MLEIGCGPLSEVRNGTVWFQGKNVNEYKNAKITFIDRRGPVEAYNEVLKELDPEFKGSIEYVQMEATNLKFEASSMDEILIANVLGAHTRQEDQYKILSEAARVLKNNGELVVVETYTPREALPSGRYDYKKTEKENLDHLLEELGNRYKDFGLEIKVKELPINRSDYRTNLASYPYMRKYSCGGMSSDWSFVIVFTKVNQTSKTHTETTS